MNDDLANFLQKYVPVAAERPVWDNGRMPMIEHTYISRELPPENYVTSVRTLLFRGDEILVIRDHMQNPYIIPGGRRDPGERIEAALRRELMEETGWRLVITAVLGFFHFHHLGPKPDGYRYAYPDFLQVVFTAVAHSFHPELMEEDPYVTETSFQPVAAAAQLPLGPCQQAMLAAALKQRKDLL